MRIKNVINCVFHLCLFLVFTFACSNKKNIEIPKTPTGDNQIEKEPKSKLNTKDDIKSNSSHDKTDARVKELQEENRRLREKEILKREEERLAEENKEKERLQKVEMDEKKNPSEGIICIQDMAKQKRYCSHCENIILRIKRLKSDTQWKCTLLTESSWGVGNHLGTSDCKLEPLRSMTEKWKLKTVKDEEIVGTIKQKINDQKEHEATFQVRWDYKDRPSEVKPLYMNCQEVELKQKGYEMWTAFE